MTPRGRDVTSNLSRRRLVTFIRDTEIPDGFTVRAAATCVMSTCVPTVVWNVSMNGLIAPARYLRSSRSSVR